MAKVVAMSDLHGHLPQEVPECDVLILAGDIAPDYLSSHPASGIDPGADKQSRWFKNQFQQWVDWKSKTRKIVWIAGNHDYALEKYPNLGPSIRNATYLQDSGVTINGIKFWGTPWVPHLRFWAFHGIDERLQQSVETIPTDTDILISHGPPYGYGDMCGPKWGKEEPVGSKQLHNQLFFMTPKAVVCGHIHEGAGIYRHENMVTEVCNVAIRDDKYQVVRGATDLSYIFE